MEEQDKGAAATLTCRCPNAACRKAFAITPDERDQWAEFQCDACSCHFKVGVRAGESVVRLRAKCPRCGRVYPITPQQRDQRLPIQCDCGRKFRAKRPQLAPS